MNRACHTNRLPGLLVWVFVALTIVTATVTKAQNQVELTGTHYFQSTDPQTNTLHIFAYDFQSRNVSQVTSGPYNNTFPSGSRDGRWVAFTSDRDGDSEIFIIDTETGVETQLSVNDDYDNFPSISPDGTQVAYISLRPSEFTDVWLIKSDGTGLTQLVDGDRSYNTGSWSQDGASLAVVGLDEIQNELFVFDTTTGLVEQTYLLPTNFFSPVWSPDGRKIALDDVGGRIGILDVGTGNFEEVDLPAERNGVYWFDNTIVGYLGFDRIYTTNIETGDLQFYPITLGDQVTNLSGVESAILINGTETPTP